jgi:hypothetical protein
MEVLIMTVKELKEKLTKAVDEGGGFEKGLEIGYEFRQDIVKKHPWVPIVSNCTLGAIIFAVGFKKGIKRNPIEYVVDEDIIHDAEVGFNKAAELLDVFDEIKTLASNKQ